MVVSASRSDGPDVTERITELAVFFIPWSDMNRLQHHRAGADRPGQGRVDIVDIDVDLRRVSTQRERRWSLGQRLLGQPDDAVAEGELHMDQSPFWAHRP